MKITQITRTVSDLNYSNMSLTATIGPDDDVIKVSIELDTKIRQALKAVNDNIENVERNHQEIARTKDYLHSALEYAEKKSQDIPF